MSSRPPLTKTEKAAIVVCGLIALPVVASVVLFGGKDNEPTWNIPPAATRPVPNGYDDYVAAAKATVRFTPEVDPASDVKSQPPGTPYALKNYSVARRKQWLQANAKAFALVQQGLSTLSMAPDPQGGMSGDWSKLRQLARDMSARSRTLQMEGKPGATTMSVLDTLQMAQDTTRGGALLPRLVGIAIMAIGRSPLEDWNKTINSLNANEARVAARRLETLLAHEPKLVETLTNSKREDLIGLQRFLGTPGWRGSWKPRTSFSGTTDETISQVWQRQTIPKRTVYDNAVRVLDANIAAAKQPYSQLKSPPPDPKLDVFSQDLVSSSYRTAQNEARSATSNNMLLLRLALRAYIAEHGQAPPTLSALSPSYLKSVPTDVYNDGKPLFYTPQGKTYKLWSVGPDGVNDGGVPLARRSGDKGLLPVQNMLENKGDFVAGLCR